MRNKKASGRLALEPNRWAGLPMLETAHRLNARSFALLAEAAQRQGADIECGPVYEARELWARVDARACQRASRCPVLLLDLNFRRPDWWRRVSVDSARTPPVSGLVTKERSAALVREILLEAWSSSRSMPTAASLLFGMAPEVRRVIAGLYVPDVDRIALEHSRSLRPRWHCSRTFWRHLLEAAVGSDDEALEVAHLHCLQLIGSELPSRCD